MQKELKKLQSEYWELQVIKNWIKEMKNSHNIEIKAFLYDEHKRACDKQIKVKKQINKLCE